MERYEYKVLEKVRFSDMLEFQNWLNDLGLDGWELASFDYWQEPNPDQVSSYVFKRKIG